ncbi:DNA ligase D [Pedobacter xixiisoli]|uniref:DNA ligase (ATP) n=1 Tax=Pedobacter xixiisoli TaxID=1476464 RepID=A0A285ZWR1_9SPHI|nr:DNA ligase D [Pedobacter xixiisoli]SOD14070.1 bifunctional non-homologous end joining protein LigD [Pedobacter xixiisoli]
MGLDKYAKKRDFTKTAEPKSGKSTDKDKLIFVIQKHDASRLHYDFRLEMEGILKSWAVPKGPSLDPKTKRLAMMVEDHPFDYRTFEGIIPKGEYGGGTVIVWDQGWYEPLETIKGKKAQEKHLLSQLKDGSVKVKLHGEKLNGEFALVRTNGMGENSWLLIKHDDDYAAKKDVTKLDTSVLSGKTIAEMEKSAGAVWTDKGEQKIEAKQPKPSKKSTKKISVEKDAEVGNASAKLDSAKILKSAPKGAIPKAIKPMLATLVDEPFDNEEWQYEVKWDGYRALATLNKGKVELLSRNNKSFNDRFYPIYKLLQNWNINAVIDGELLVLNEKGISNFGTLQNWRSEADGELVFYVFDILWYEGKNLTGLTLVERQAILNEVLPTDDDRIRISKVFDTSGIDFFDAADRIGLEGIMAKSKSSTYLVNKRSKDWLKIKVSKRQEVIIAGFTRNEDTSKLFSSLILAVWENKQLTYVGKVGTGFSDADQKKMMAQFEPYIVKKSPFTVAPDINKLSRFQHRQLNAKATWMKPELVCEVAFTEVTDDGVFRHPSFQGMRSDKDAKEVIRENAADTEEIVAPTKEKSNGEKGTSKNIDTELVRPPKETVPKTLLNPKEQTQVRKVKGKELKFNNLAKLYWPEDGVSKRDMFNYYYAMADFILPYLKDRPLSLNRFPGGIHGKSFYQKDVKGKAPDWAKTFPYSTSDGEAKEYLVGDDIATLLWTNTLGCIEVNPWFSRVQSPDHPDYCVIDLDPDKHHFDKVIEAANVVKKVLDAIDVPCYAKTSGSTGIHIYIPLGGKYDYDQSQLFAKIIVTIVNKQIPSFTSLERMIAARKGKMYLDFLQNRPGATIAGPYSLRPKPRATVSMPLDWDELKPGLKMTDFTIFNAFERVQQKGDIFKGVLGKGIDLEKAILKAKEIYP